MSYVKTVWETGDVITAAKLNNLEDGVEAAGSGVKSIVLTESDDSSILGAPWKEIKAAFDAKVPIFVFYPEGDNMPFLVTAVYADLGNDQYVVNAMDLQSFQLVSFISATEDDNPSMSTN